MPPQYDGTPPTRKRRRRASNGPAPTPAPDYHSQQHAAQTHYYHPTTDVHSSQHAAQTRHYHPHPRAMGTSVRAALRASRQAARGAQHHARHAHHHRAGKAKSSPSFARSLNVAIRAGLGDAAGTGAFPAYQDFYNRLFAKAGKYYPGAEYSPVKLAYTDPYSKGTRHMIPNGEWVDDLGHPGEPVHVAPEAAASFMSKFWSDRNWAKTTPLHEWTHTIQLPGLSHAASEGGAEAYAKSVADQIGMAYDTEAGGYGAYYRRNRRRDRNWWTQFIGSPYGGPH